MKITRLAIPDVILIEPRVFGDERGYFFESFNQVSSGATRKYGGTGLGLAIVKRLVELQKGTVKASSEVGEGSIFEFEVKYKFDTDHQIEKEIENTEIDFSYLKGKTFCWLKTTG